MLERTCFHIDREEPKKHKSGWFFQTFHFKTDSRECERIEIRACDYEHAIKQAKAMGRREGFKVLEEGA